MIYWDNAATTYPKPLPVQREVRLSMSAYGGNPGRGGHQLSMASAEQVYECREAVARFFGLSDPTGVIFMPNCTTALNTVVHGVMRDGGRVIVSDLEHNAVWRSVNALRGQPRVDVAAWSPDEDEIVENFRRAIRADTRLIVCTHASNVFGVTFPIRKLAALAHRYGILLCVDAAQTAGVLPIDMQTDDIDYLCVAAHKGLYAPMGMGLLLCRERERVPSLIQGGTGSYSMLANQPDELPERLESGTPNLLGICGLRAGLQFVERQGRERIYKHELSLLKLVHQRLSGTQGVQLYTETPTVGDTAAALSVTVNGLSPEEVARELDAHGVAVRAGLHCAPLAHRRFGTLPFGTVRLAPSAFSTHEEAEIICKLFHQIAQKSLHNNKNML